MSQSAGHNAYIGLGSNLGDQSAIIDAAIEAIDQLSGVEVLAASSKICTPPLPTAAGVESGGWYTNAVVAVRTTRSARELLDALLDIERAHGRDRSRAAKWSPRTLDLDLLIYCDCVIDEPGLAVPHPEIANRLFVLEPLAELDPAMIVPGVTRRGRTVSELLAQLKTAQLEQEQRT